MTRPNIIRADTIDLQDHNAPSAQDHSRKPDAAPLGVGPAAPHQAAELRQVQNERQAEEDHLAQAWTNGKVLLSEDPPSDDEATTLVDGAQEGLHGDQIEEDEDDMMDDDLMDKISSSPSIDDEDIDFEFVYALHTFVATVDGQANATKGDTMVLLDDSNSYWWLVRVVKDSTIGYLPAEHIETPTERLARLNKHRNIDLAATMLGDTTEKSKNPLKKAMRRRNAKTVTFGALNYVEASDYDYSSDEDESRDSSDMLGDGIAEEANGGAVQEPEDTRETTIAPLSVAAVKSNMQEAAEDGDDEDRVGRRRNVEGVRPSSEALSDQQERPRKSKDGTVRDSFFKDDTVETRKISLTPNLLKDDSQQQPRRDMKGTFDSIDKEIAKSKEDKKKKEKKPGMLSGLFKKKDKKAKGDTGSETATISSEISRGSPTSDESATDLQAASVSRKSSVGKLQKVQPAVVAAEATQQANGARPLGSVAETTSTVEAKESSVRSVSPEKNLQSSLSQKPSLRVKTAEKTNDVLHGIGNRMRSNSDAVKREKVKTAKTREALDVGSSPEDEVDDPFADPENEAVHTHDRLSESPVHITAADAVHDSEPPALVGDSSSHTSSDELTSLRSSPSPINEDVGTRDFASRSHLGQSPPSPVSPLSTHSVLPVSTHNTGLKQAAATGAQIPPAPTREPPPQPSTLQTDLSQHMVSSSSNIPARNASTSTTASTTPSSYAPTWSDTSLRHYLDSTSHDEVRDLLIIVNDTSNVEPVGMDHEYMKDLFVDERRGLKDLDAELDRLLGGWLDRRRGVKSASIVTPVMASAPSMGQAVAMNNGAHKTAVSPISPVSAAVSPISLAGSETRTRVMPPVPKTKAKPVTKPAEVTMDAGDF